jgi:hypothetical protein
MGKVWSNDTLDAIDKAINPLRKVAEKVDEAKVEVKAKAETAETPKVQKTNYAPPAEVQKTNYAPPADVQKTNYAIKETPTGNLKKVP